LLTVIAGQRRQARRVRHRKKEYVMKEFPRKISAGLLTLVLLGTVGGLLAKSLTGPPPRPVPAPAAARTYDQPIETVVVVGHRWTTTVKAAQRKRDT
jgi:hypothetical protein